MTLRIMSKKYKFIYFTIYALILSSGFFAAASRGPGRNPGIFPPLRHKTC